MCAVCFINSLVWSLRLFMVVIFFKKKSTYVLRISDSSSDVCSSDLIYLCGFTLNTISLMALIVATGFVVDDAIVVLENIMRHIEQGATPLRAAIRGAREVGFTEIGRAHV